MAIEHFDGFDDYSSAQISRYITVEWVNGASTVFDSNLTIASSSGRNSTGSLHVANISWGGVFTLTSQATRTIGFAFKPGALPGDRCIICFFADASTIQLNVKFNSDGTLSVVRGTVTGTVLSTSSLTLTAATWVYIEFQATINNTTGSYELRVNGVTYTSGSGVNTRSSANNSANQVGLGGGGGATPALVADFDDFYSSNDSTFLGDCRVETKLPTGDGATNNFTRSTGATNFSNVDESTSNDDTDYNFSSTTGDIDLYTYPNLTTSAGAVKALMTVPVVRNDAAGTVTEQSVYRSGGTNYFGASKNVGSTTYQALSDIQTTDPNTSAAWTVSNINSAQFGIKRVA